MGVGGGREEGARATILVGDGTHSQRFPYGKGGVGEIPARPNPCVGKEGVGSTRVSSLPSAWDFGAMQTDRWVELGPALSLGQRTGTSTTQLAGECASTRKP